MSIVLCLCMGMIHGTNMIVRTILSNFDKNVSELQSQNIESKEKKNIVPLDVSINNYISQNQIDPSTLGICIRSFDGKDEFILNGDADFFAASVYKLPLAVIWYDKVNKGEASLDELLYYGPNHYEDETGIGRDYGFGAEIPIGVLLNSMIVLSDNNAGHILFENLGGWIEFKNIAATYSDCQLSEAFFGGENYLTANYASDLIDYIYSNKDKFTKLTTDMKASMPNQYLDSKVNTNVAQKYGRYNWAENATGFVEDANRPYSIVVFTQLGTYGIDVMGDINKICYEYFNEQV